MGISRRDMLKISGVAAAGAMTTSAFAAEKKGGQACTASCSKEARLPKATGPRVVVLGGGPSGLTIAKYVKQYYPKADVVLIEKRSMFISGFVSNLYVAGLVDLEFITHDYEKAARKHKYTLLTAAASGVDREKKIVYTNEGTVKYDILVLSPGIDYNYKPYVGDDIELETRLRQEYPAAFIPGSETLTIKEKLANFEGGTFVQTVPGGNYRCLPGPYERACLMAWYLKKNKIKGKVLVLDANPDVTIKKDGFHAAFKELYKDHLEYVPSAKVKKIDLSKKSIVTEVDTFSFDDASFYPGVRGAKILELAGVAKDTAFNPMEGNINDKTYKVIGDDHVYIGGDSRPMPFSKSGNTANTEGKYIAKLIAAQLGGKAQEWESPNTVCYSLVNGDPMEGISVSAYYKFDEKGKSWGFDRVNMVEKRNPQAGLADKQWAQGIYADMFG